MALPGSGGFPHSLHCRASAGEPLRHVEAGDPVSLQHSPYLARCVRRCDFGQLRQQISEKPQPIHASAPMLKVKMPVCRLKPAITK
jgi:hypothetical protein